MSPARRQRQAAAAPSAPPAETLPDLAPDPRADPRRDASLTVSGGGLQMTTLDDMFRFAQYVEKSKMCPEGMKAPDIVVAMQTGAELGFSPIRSLVACPVVKGRASIAGEAALALIRASGTLDPRGDIEVWMDGEGEQATGYCRAWRKGWDRPREVTFTYADARAAGLTRKTRTGEASMYDKYREDMLIWRAASRMAKRNFSDITLGLELAEVARNLPPVERDVTPPPDTPGGQGPDPLLASVIDAGEPIEPEVVGAETEPIPQAQEEAATADADLSEYPEPAEEQVRADRDLESAADRAEARVQAGGVPISVDPEMVSQDEPGEWKPPAVCGKPDPETDDVQCMREYDHDGRCDWDVDVEAGGQLPL